MTHADTMRRLGLCLMALALAACSRPAARTAIGDAARGKALAVRLGCGSCHVIPGIEDADGKVGPPLGDIGERTIIAGVLPNTPANMIVWLKSPQSVTPGNAMPDLGIGDGDARDIAAYLDTLRS